MISSWMKHDLYPSLFLFLLSFGSLKLTNASRSVRSFNFEIEERFAPLASSVPAHTSIFKKWPSEGLRAHLPDYLSVSVMTSKGPSLDQNSYLFMGVPIHVVTGDILNMTIMNKLPATGLSIHFHGFEMKNSVEYDGVVGLTQCPISPHQQFTYSFIVEEDPGTSWYHTHSGNLGIESHNMIKAPLIVHPNTTESRLLVDTLNQIATAEVTGDKIDYRPLLSYANERILFISDGFLKSDAVIEMYSVGGLNPPVSMNRDGFIAASMEYEYGTMNGKMREVIHVQRGQTYKFRIINGGIHFAYRVKVDGFQMKIIAADSTPVHPTVVDEIILHNAERFDVEITISEELSSGDTFWIRADTVEDQNQGYENGIRAILHVVDDMEDANQLSDDNILDPTEDIVNSKVPVEELITMNCYSAAEIKAAERSQKGGCLPIIYLESQHKFEYWDKPSLSHHTVDFDVSPNPIHAHFVRVDYGNWYQFVGSGSHMLRPDYDEKQDVHPHAAMMTVPSFESVIIIWRNKSLMDHPMHLHGYKMEILDVYVAHRKNDCNLMKCNLADIYTPEKVFELDKIRRGTRPMKDTFIMPAGGAVVTRVLTRKPDLWFAHCHMEVHREDGMAFIFNVGNYQPPTDGSWLPDDFPSCETPFLKTQHKEPHCDCYINEDAVLGTSLNETYKCSRKYLCMHEQSQVAYLTEENKPGFKLRSTSPVPGYGISLIFVCIVALATLFFVFVLPCFEKEGLKCHMLTKTIVEGMNKITLKSITNEDNKPSFFQQFLGLYIIQWREYRPGAINVLRVVEVSGLGILAGLLFHQVGDTNTATGFAEKTSFLFFSTTLWTQTRMYPAIGDYFEWKKKDFLILRNKQYDWLPVLFSRMIVVIACEAWWCFVYVLCAFPLAHMFGNVSTVLAIATFLSLNNSCYISIGAVFGTVMPTVSLGMIGATLFGQTTVICAGFFTELPSFIGWFRYISPIFYTFKGIVKKAYQWDDTYQCVKGDSLFGANSCPLEINPAIDDYKERGINVATFGDPSSSAVYMEFILLIVLFSSFQGIVILYHYFRITRNIRKKESTEVNLTQTKLDERFDKEIAELKRSSLFLEVNDEVSSIRTSIRASKGNLIDGLSLMSFKSYGSNSHRIELPSRAAIDDKGTKEKAAVISNTQLPMRAREGNNSNRDSMEFLSFKSHESDTHRIEFPLGTITDNEETQENAADTE